MKIILTLLFLGQNSVENDSVKSIITYLCNISVDVSEHEVVGPAVAMADNGQWLPRGYQLHHRVEEVALAAEVLELADV